MSQVTAIDFKQRFPEFASLSDTVVEFALEEASLFMMNWQGVGANLAKMYLAAHVTAVSRVVADTDGRDIISETIGRLSTTYRAAGAGFSFGDLETTAYGKRYLQIRSIGQKMFESISSDAERSGYWGLGTDGL
jgi:Protein of unknown function (DUF4054)